MRKILVVSLFFAASSFAQEDHPIIKQYEGSVLIAREPGAFGDLLIPLGPATHDGNRYGFAQSATVEGQTTKIRYKAPAGRTSLEVFRNYGGALKSAGFNILFSCTKSSCGESDTFTQTLHGIGAQPLTLNQKTQAYLSARLSRPSGDVYVRLLSVENHAWAGEAKMEPGQVVVQLDIVETRPMESGMVTVDADAMSAAIRQEGRVALYAIYFDRGKADMKPESEPALREIARLMSTDKSLRLLVVGHTDTDGSIDANRDLSARRAKAVVDQLSTTHGIAAARLTPVGVGFAAPTASNRSADGKARNRRVELVEF